VLTILQLKERRYLLSRSDWSSTSEDNLNDETPRVKVATLSKHALEESADDLRSERVVEMRTRLHISSNTGPSELPPLPTINSRWILQRIFTHRSRSKRGFEDSPYDPSPDNEQ
jgi:hypothetical protein